METNKTYNTLNEALKAIANIGKAYATIADCNLIKLDNATDCNAIRKDFEAFKANGMLKRTDNFFSDKFPYRYYMAVREHGQEGSTDKSHVIERMKHFKGELATMTLTYNGKIFQIDHIF